MATEQPFDIEQRWPDIFEPLSGQQRRNVVQTLAMQWHEGWEPNRADTALFADYVRGAISREELMRRGDVLDDDRSGTG